MKIATLAALIIASLSPSASAQSLLPAVGPDEGGAPASPMAATDPFLLIYRVPGVSDSGSMADVGTATAFMCTNFSRTSESIRITVRDFDSVVYGQETYLVQPRHTHTVATHWTKSLIENDGSYLVRSGGVRQGLATIEATSTNVHCSVMIVDSSLPNGNGVALHMVRFNPHPGSVE